MGCHEHNKLDPNDTVSISGQPTCQDGLFFPRHLYRYHLVSSNWFVILLKPDMARNVFFAYSLCIRDQARYKPSNWASVPRFSPHRPPNCKFVSSAFLRIVCGRYVVVVMPGLWFWCEFAPKKNARMWRGFGCGEVLAPCGQPKGRAQHTTDRPTRG